MEAREGLQILHPTDGTTSGRQNEPRVDIVFIHGLGAHPIDNWKKDGHVWIREDVPKAFPDARVMTFGYNANVAKDASRGRIRQFAQQLLGALKDNRTSASEIQRPLILIGHSLGGLVAKQAMWIAMNDPDFTVLKKCCYGLIFLATPHRGSSKASIGKVLTNIAKISLTRPKTQLLEELEADSVALQNLSEDFRHLHSQFKIASFYEMKEMDIGKFSPKIMIVEPYSAKMDIEGEIIRPMNADHSSICKFTGENDPLYKSVKGVLSVFVDGAKIAIPQSFVEENMRKIQSLMEKLNSKNVVIPRKILLDYMDTRLEGTCGWILQESKIKDWLEKPASEILFPIFLSGKAGCGKSLLCSRLIEEALNRYHDDWKKESLTVCESDIVLYFFCNNRSNDSRTSEAAPIICSLIVQLLRALCRQAEFLQYADEVVPDRQPETAHSLLSTLAKLLVPFDRSWIILDGIDECKDYDAFLHELQLFTQISSCRVRLFISGRDEYSIWKHVGEHHWWPLSVTKSEGLDHRNQSDLYQYIEERIGRIAQQISRVRTNTELRSRMRLVLKERAQGMFLWVKLAVADLIDQAEETTPDLESVLDSPPVGLEEIYLHYCRRLMSRISRFPNQYRRATACLRWLTCSLRPLQVSELLTGSSFVAGQVMLAETSYPDPEGALRKCLGSLIEFHEPTLSRTDGQHIPATSLRNNKVVSLIHSSFRDYLLKPSFCAAVGQILRSDLGPFFVSKRDAHAFVATTTLAYLSANSNLPIYVELDRDSQQLDLPLLDYSGRWHTHVQESGSTGSKSIILQKHLELFYLKIIQNLLVIFERFEVEILVQEIKDEFRRSLSPSFDDYFTSDKQRSIRDIIHDVVTATDLLYRRLETFRSQSTKTTQLAQAVPINLSRSPLDPFDARLVYDEEYVRHWEGILVDPLPVFNTRYHQDYPVFKKDPARAIERALREVVRKFPNVKARISQTNGYYIPIANILRSTTIDFAQREGRPLQFPSEGMLTLALLMTEMLHVFPVLGYVPISALHKSELFKFHLQDPQFDRAKAVMPGIRRNHDDFNFDSITRYGFRQNKDRRPLPRWPLVILISGLPFNLFWSHTTPGTCFALALLWEVSWFVFRQNLDMLLQWLRGLLPCRIFYPYKWEILYAPFFVAVISRHIGLLLRLRLWEISTYWIYAAICLCLQSFIPESWLEDPELRLPIPREAFATICQIAFFTFSAYVLGWRLTLEGHAAAICLTIHAKFDQDPNGMRDAARRVQGRRQRTKLQKAMKLAAAHEQWVREDINSTVIEREEVSG